MKVQAFNSAMEWLLDEFDNPSVRFLTLRDLTDLDEDFPIFLEARKEAHHSDPIARILDNMHPEGYWSKPGPGYSPKYRSTVWAIILLAQLGGSVKEDSRISDACDYLMDHAYAEGGYFSHSGAPGGTFDCLQGNLCWAIMKLGYKDLRLLEAFDWLARSQIGEGIAAKEDKQAFPRYYAYKCGPNFQCGANYNLPCAWGAEKVLRAFSILPVKLRTEPINRAIQLGVDFFFSVEPTPAAWPYHDRINNTWWKFGFPIFYNTDLLQVAETLAALGYADDPRLVPLMDYIESKMDDEGKWILEHDYKDKTWGNYGKKGQPNKWVTLRALRALCARDLNHHFTYS